MSPGKLTRVMEKITRHYALYSAFGKMVKLQRNITRKHE
jgi:hypothetical protein